MTQVFDTIILGAGIIGSSVAMHLSKKSTQSLALLDWDMEGMWSSSERNAGGVRASWQDPLNIQICLDSIRFFEQVASEVGFRQKGYLWLFEEKDLEKVNAIRKIQTSFGCQVEKWSAREVLEKVPILNKSHSYAGGVFSVQDGLLNPNLLKNFYRKQAQKKGVKFFDRYWVDHIELTENKVILSGKRADSVLSEEEKKLPLLGKALTLFQKVPFQSFKIYASKLVLCMGPWAKSINEHLGVPLKCWPLLRSIVLFQTQSQDRAVQAFLKTGGMVVEPNGVYFHPEGPCFLAGFSETNEIENKHQIGYRFESDHEAFFLEKIWPVLYESSHFFEKLKMMTAWSGLYEMSEDHAGIVGEVVPHVFEAHSFSGHGVMQSYTIGKALSELILEGTYRSLDLSPLHRSRFQKGKKRAPERVI